MASDQFILILLKLGENKFYVYCLFLNYPPYDSPELDELWGAAKTTLHDQIQDFVARELAQDDDPKANCPKIAKLVQVLSSYKVRCLWYVLY